MGAKQTMTKLEKTYQEELDESNNLLLAPVDLSEEERIVWEEITSLIIASTRYKKTTADVELVRQYCQTKICETERGENTIKIQSDIFA